VAVSPWSAEPARALELGEQLLSLAERSQDPQQLLWAHGLVGAARWLRAELALARKHLDKALAHYTRGSQHPLNTLFGFHAGVMSLVWQAGTLWLMGLPDQARRHLQEALHEAQAGDDPVTLAYVSSAAGLYLSLVDRAAPTNRPPEETLDAMKQAGSAFELLAEIFAGHEAIEKGSAEASLQRIRQGISALQGMGGAISHAGQLVLLAQGYAATGQTQAGLDTLDQALTWMDRTGVCMFEAEAHRLRGDLLLLNQPRQNETIRAAEACFRTAICIARRSRLPWWELRATVSLCRLLQEQTPPGDLRHAEAHRMLAEIYGRFTEGFDTLDLSEARALLNA
jgi:tetratricopeptide (TPR) repeat protein